MAGVITINFKVMKNGMADLGMKSPLYLPGPVEPHYGPGRYLTFEGFSVDEHGKQVRSSLKCWLLNVPRVVEQWEVSLSALSSAHLRRKEHSHPKFLAHKISSTTWT